MVTATSSREGAGRVSPGNQVSVGGLGSLGRPSTRSPTMLRWIWLVPPQMVSEREKKNDDIIGLTGYPSRRLSRAAPGQPPDSGPLSINMPSAPWMSTANSIAALCISDQNILLVAPRAIVPMSPLPESVADRLRRPLIRRIWILV